MRTFPGLFNMCTRQPTIVKALRPEPPTLKDDDDDVLPTVLPQVQDMGGGLWGASSRRF